uniref:Uncharacterized protein n=1 Tax=Romanomermis culicivorax TaxID=13658 RepID=A0A915HFU4_ROMCU
MYSALMTSEEEFRTKNRLPVTDRSPTDVFCCFAFGIFVIVFGLVAITALCYGDPRQIVYPTDSAGRLCGVKTKSYDFRNKPHLVFLDLIVCFQELSTNKTQCPTPQICVDGCPKKYFAVGPESQYEKSEIPRLINDTICISENVKDGIKDYEGLNKAILEGKCASYYLPSSPRLIQSSNVDKTCQSCDFLSQNYSLLFSLSAF